MAERGTVCYSFYVPEQDAQLRSFLSAQSNLSLSMRLLAKAFLAHGADTGPDVSLADLGDLVRAMSPERIAPAAGAVKRSAARKTSEAAQEEAGQQDSLAGQEAAAGPEPDADLDTDIETETDAETDVEPEADTGAGADGNPPGQDQGQEPDTDSDPVIEDDPGEADAQDAGTEPAVSEREAYNAAMNAGVPVFGDDDDIEALMGDLG